MGTFIKVVICPLVVATLLTACGGGGSSPPVDNTPLPPTLSDDASLSALAVSTGSFNETFSSATYAYTQSTGAPETRVTPTLSDGNATVTVNGVAVVSGSASGQIVLALGSNSINVVVTAEDGSTAQTYTINITRLSSDASLSGLSLSGGDLDQIFQPTHYDYTATVGYTQVSVMLTAQMTYSGASATVNGTAVSSGQPSGEIALAEGVNTITVIVTAEDGVTSETYTLELTRQSANNFAQQAYIKASNTDAHDQFGGAVALDGDTLAVGADQEDSVATGINGDELDNSASSGCTGAVYVFTRDGAGVWSQQAYVKASNTRPNQCEFGHSVALSGDTLAVGSFYEDSAATGVNGDQADTSANQAGAVYVYTRDGAGAWAQQAYVKASNTEAGDGFGWSVALSGDTLAVSALMEDSEATGVDGDETSNGAADSGAVYVYTRNAAGVWSQQAYIKASNTEPSDWFGRSVAVDGDTLAVGALWEDSAATGVNGDETNNGATDAGAVYIYTRDGGGAWSQQAYIKASNMDADDAFGGSVALSGDTLAVGATQEDSTATGINGDETDNSGFKEGAAYVFTRDVTGLWSQQAYVKASNSDPGDHFGNAVALDGDTLAVGAFNEAGGATGINGDETDNSGANRGAVYLFTRDGSGTWSQWAYVKASSTGADGFGRSVALSGDSLAVGANYEDSAATGIGGNETNTSAPNAGATYVFQ